LPAEAAADVLFFEDVFVEDDVVDDVEVPDVPAVDEDVEPVPEEEASAVASLLVVLASVLVPSEDEVAALEPSVVVVVVWGTLIVSVPSPDVLVSKACVTPFFVTVTAEVSPTWMLMVSVGS